MPSLTETSHEHHDRLLPYVDRLTALAEMLGTGDPADFRAAFDDEYNLVVGCVVPHMEAIEATLYGRLEGLMGHRHSMAPMRDEHARLRSLIASLGAFHDRVMSGTLGPAETVGLRRALYRLYSLLRVHLAEEAQYLQVLDHHLSADEKEALARGIDHAVALPM